MSKVVSFTVAKSMLISWNGLLGNGVMISGSWDDIGVTVAQYRQFFYLVFYHFINSWEPYFLSEYCFCFDNSLVCFMSNIYHSGLQLLWDNDFAYLQKGLDFLTL